MYKMEIAFNERWSCTYTRLKNMSKVSAFWKMRAKAISAYQYPLPYVSDHGFAE